MTCLGLQGNAKSLSRRPADESRLRHCSRFPCRSRFGPTQGQRQNALLAFGVCHSALLLSALPVTGAGGAFLPRQGLGVFRHSRVSGKRSQTLNSGEKHYG